MVKLFDKSMFIMLFALMIGAVVITYFVADIESKTRIEDIQTQHDEQIVSIHTQNENFTDNFLQGSIALDSAREIREVANYHFDFALFWYQQTVTTNASQNYTLECIDNATLACEHYLESYDSFGSSRPYFNTAANYTDTAKYLEIIGYYQNFTIAGQNITMIRYNATKLLIQAMENYTAGNLNNSEELMENFSLLGQMYDGAMTEFNDYKEQIDNYVFFSEIREELIE